MRRISVAQGNEKGGEGREERTHKRVEALRLKLADGVQLPLLLGERKEDLQAAGARKKVRKGRMQNAGTWE